MSGRDWLHPNPPNIFLPSLRQLRVFGVTGEIYSGLLLAIIAPPLEGLSLRTPMFSDLCRLLTAYSGAPSSPKFPRLESVVMDGGEFDVRTWQQWFSLFPNIKEITVFDSPVKDLVIIGLLSGEISSHNSSLLPGFIPCPRLEKLTVLLNYQGSAVLANAAKRRLEQGYPLRKIRVGIHSDLDEDEDEEISRTLQEFVLQVELFREAEPWPTGLRHIDEDDS
ncbi:hypothetical protein BDV98DRAFT_605290 [Pterulicium gracile]|uniref:F-box domain-containing protein n=1 Tax=Pterulicium gracile TaxID=1884261 RepID=A0A5C3QEZ7_9AGAR|nr:hypothetical protein BDV98DRAFT_605290 [Pterula gracilis]